MESGRVRVGVSLRKLAARHIPRFLLVALAVCGFAAATEGRAVALQMGVQWTGEHYRDTPEIDTVAKSGADLFRVPIEPANTPRLSNGQWNWSFFYDGLFEEAAKAGVRILPHFGGNMQGKAQLPLMSEKELWTLWAREAVARYGYSGKFWAEHPNVPYMPVTAWELWNEQNNAGLESGGATPQAFGEFVQYAGPAVQHASEWQSGLKTEVLYGALFSWQGGTSYQKYLAESWAYAGPYVTGVAFHPYAMTSATNAENLQVYRDAVAAARQYINGLAGGTSKSLWLTEIGWAAEGAQYPKGEAGQAALLHGAFDYAQEKEASYNIKAIIWYNYRDIVNEIWQYRSGLRSQSGNYRLSWTAFQEETGAPLWKPYPEELGFIRYNAATATHLDTYSRGPAFKTLLSSSPTAYPKITDPQNVQAVAIDTNGDGVDGLSFLRYNSTYSNTYIDAYSGVPSYKTLVASCNTGFPKVADPQTVQALAIDSRADLAGDELGFVRFNGSGATYIDSYTGGSCYNTLATSSPTGYPAIGDPQNLQALAIDTDGDSIDELGFVRLNSAPNAYIDLYTGAPQYKKPLTGCKTGYPTVTDPQNVQVLAIDWNGDGADELAFLRYNPLTLNTHLDAYRPSTPGGCYDTLVASTDVGYPKVSDPQNVQALALNVDLAPFVAPAMWGSDPLGEPSNGGLTSDPDIASWGNNRLDIFARGKDKALWHRAWDNGWLGWDPVPNGASVEGGPGAVSWGPNRMDVVFRNTSNSVNKLYYQAPSWFAIDPLGQPSTGKLTSDPDISSWDENRLDVFARGFGNKLWHRAWQNGWFAWDQVTTGGPLGSGPSAVSWGPYRIDVVAKALGTATEPDNRVEHWYWNGSQFVNDNLGGNITSDPDIASWGNNRLDVFARGPEGGLIHKSWNGINWSGWESLGGPTLVGGPSAVSWGPGRIDVVARVAAPGRTEDHALYHWFYQE